MVYPTKPQLRVLSALSTDSAIVWFATLLTTTSGPTLLRNVIFGMFFAYVALICENNLEKNYYRPN